jgi:hypothetical protein
VLLDKLGVVVLDMAQRNEAALDARAHLLLVEIETRADFAHQHAVPLQPQKVFPRLRVDRVTVGIGASGQVDLRAIDSQQTVRVALREFGRLGGVDDVIRYARDLGGVGWDRDETLKGANSHGCRQIRT